MSVQDHIENILNAEGQGALDAWYDAIKEHPQDAMKIHDAQRVGYDYASKQRILLDGQTS